MKLQILSPAFEGPDRARLYIESAGRVGLAPRFFGNGLQWNGWREAKGPMLIDEIRWAIMNGATHVMYADAYDTFWVNGEESILEAYRSYGGVSLLFSCEKDPFPRPETCAWSLRSSGPPDWPSEKGCYLNSGSFMGEAHTVLSCLERVYRAYGEITENDQEWWHRGWQDGIVAPKLDTRSAIWKTMSGFEDDRAKEQQRAFDFTRTCLVHFNGRLPGIEDLYQQIWRTR